MTETVLTLPIAPEHLFVGLGVLGLILLSVLAYWMLAVTGRAYRRPAWEEIPEAWRGIVIFLGLVWLGLFGLTVIAAYDGVWKMIHPSPAEGGAEVSGLGFGALLAAMLGAPFVIWGTVLKHRTVTFQKEGHITDRINKAVEMLGAEKTVKTLKEDRSGSIEVTVPNIEVRIGAILSLERIAQDSTAYDKGRDHVRVMEILCAYVRENSNARKPVDFPEPEWKPLEDGASEEERKAHLEKRKERFGRNFAESSAWKWAWALSPPRADIATALTVLGRRTLEQRLVEASWPIPPNDKTVWPFDLRPSSLPELEGGKRANASEIARFKAEVEAWEKELSSYDGYRPDLRGANLQGADLSRAVLSGAKLNEARMEGANLNKARLEGAKLSGTRLEGAVLSSAKLENAKLGEARLEGANLFKARMEGVNLHKARMEGANLGKAQMAGGFLGEARLENTNFYKAHLEGAFLGEARMEWADLSDASLESTNLMAAGLEGAAMKFELASTVPLDSKQICSIFADASVILQESLSRPAHWPVWEMDWNNFETELYKWRDDPDNYIAPQRP